jgi:hypothetical protein
VNHGAALVAAAQRLLPHTSPHARETSRRVDGVFIEVADAAAAGTLSGMATSMSSLVG